jgi:hypothetical protein
LLTQAIAVTESPLADDAQLVRLQLAPAQAATLLGDEPRARRAASTAWALAREDQDWSAAATAALLYSGEPELNVIGDEPGTVMLSTTLELGELSTGERARIMARLGSALSYQDHDRATHLAIEAIDLARSGRDTSALAYAMRCRLRGWFDPASVDARIAMATELTRIAQELDDAVTESWGWRWQVVINFDRGDIGAIEGASRNLKTLAEQLRLPNHHWSAAIRLAALRVFQGRFEEADRLIADATEHGKQIDNFLTNGVEARVVQMLAWFRGSDAYPSCGTGRAMTSALIWAEADIQPNLDRVAADPESVLGPDIDRMATICSVALAVRVVPHRSAAAAAYPYAARHVDLVATTAPGATMNGSMHLYAGILANAAGDTGKAVEHFRGAIRANAELGALPFLAFAEHELANITPDRVEANHASAHATDLARTLGIHWLQTAPTPPVPPKTALLHTIAVTDPSAT